MLNPRNLTNGQEQYDHNVDYCGFEEKMKMLTMPDYFPEQLPRDVRRTILLEICGDVDDDMVIASTPELKDLPEYLQKPGSTIQRYSVEDYKKIAQTTMADINAEQEELKRSEKALAERYEKLEYGVYLCELFTKTKVRMLTERINGKLKNVRFRLFREQVNGDIKDDCEVMIPTEDGNRVPFTFANNAARINAGLEIINTLSHHWGIEMPVFIDNAESSTKLLQDT